MVSRHESDANQVDGKMVRPYAQATRLLWVLIRFICRFHLVCAAFVLVFAADRAVDKEMTVGAFSALAGTIFAFDGQVLAIFSNLIEMANGWVLYLHSIVQTVLLRFRVDRFAVLVQLAEILNASTNRKVLVLLWKLYITSELCPTGVDGMAGNPFGTGCKAHGTVCPVHSNAL